jgi:hypothetical protein
MLPLVSLTGALAIYLALELDLSWTGIAQLRRGKSNGHQSLIFWSSVPKIDLPFGQKAHCAGLASGLAWTDFPPVLYSMCAPHALGLVLSRVFLLYRCDNRNRVTLKRTARMIRQLRALGYRIETPNPQPRQAQTQ